jgi:tripartite-type tricarboxylate transporter receptor subunit TctC
MTKSLCASLTVVLTLITTSVFAWTPPGIIKIVVGQSPGGGNEFAFRGISPFLEKNNNNTSFIINHKPGLDNVVAMNYFAQQRADGSHILVVVQATGFVAAPVAYADQLKIDPMTYTPITALAQSPMAFIINPKSQITSVPQLIQHLRNPNVKFNIGISGSINLLAYNYFIDRIGVSADRVQSIRFNSPTEASVAVASGNLDMAIVPLSVPQPLITANRVKLLAHTGSSTISELKSAELMKDHIPGFVLNATWSAFLPPNTSPDIVKWFSNAFINALNDPGTKQYYNNSWATAPAGYGPTELNRQLVELKKTWSPVAKKVLTPESK